MAFISPRMGLKIWNAGADPYNHEQLADNFLKLDQHDHSPGRGMQVVGAGIADGSITTNHIADGTILGADISDGAILANHIGFAISSGGTAPAVVTVIPASPTNGQEIYLQPPGQGAVSTAAPSLWHLRYSSTTLKWHFLGGSPIVLNPGGFSSITLGSSWVPFTDEFEWSIFRGGLYHIAGHFTFRTGAAALVQFNSALYNSANVFQNNVVTTSQTYHPGGTEYVQVGGTRTQLYASATPANKLRFVCAAPSYAPVTTVGYVEIRITPVYLEKT